MEELSVLFGIGDSFLSGYVRVNEVYNTQILLFLRVNTVAVRENKIFISST